MHLHKHSITLHGPRITLRPLTENDWDLLLAWNSDPDVLYWADDNDTDAYDLPTLQSIYRSISQNAICFIIESNSQPIGEGWLQRMNLDPILTQYPHQDCRRIDLMIGDKARWGQGLGTETIRILTDFGFAHEHADRIFGMVSDYNTRSRRAFARVGYIVDTEISAPPGGKTTVTYAMALTRAMWHADNANGATPPQA